MPEPVSFGSLDRPRPAPTRPDPETPFRIALFGNYGGRPPGAAAPDLAGRRGVKVRHESLDAALAKRPPVLRLSAAGERVELKFSSQDDFHPDQIFDHFDPFADMGEDEQGDLMRAVLHHRDFQSLESAWRGLEWLLRRADKGGRVEVVLYDVTREELAADLTASEDLSRCGLYRLLVETATQGPKGERWGLLVGDYLFDRSAADARLLGRMAKVAAQAAAPFLAGAAPAVHAAPDTPPAAAVAWDALRRLPEASLLGLVLPRFLLRPPYGPDTSSIDRFDFGEFASSAKKPYLWGNGALACAALLAQGFQKQGWAFKPGGLLDLTDMPMHVGTDEDGDPVATVGETWVDRRLADPLGKQGFMCLLGVRGANSLQLARVQSLSQPPKDRPFSELWGPWGQEGVAAPVSSTPSLSVKVGFDASLAPRPAPPAPAPRGPTPEATAEAPDAPPETAPAAAEASDDNLDALLQGLEPSPPAADGPAPDAPAADAPAEEIDPELEALLKEMGGDAG